MGKGVGDATRTAPVRLKRNQICLFENGQDSGIFARNQTFGIPLKLYKLRAAAADPVARLGLSAQPRAASVVSAYKGKPEKMMGGSCRDMQGGEGGGEELGGEGRR